MNSTENVTLSVPPDNTSLEPGSSNNGLVVVLCILVGVLGGFLTSFVVSFLRSSTWKIEEKPFFILDEGAAQELTPTSTETDDSGVIISTEDVYDNSILNDRITNATEDLSTTQSVKNETPATTYRLGPYGKEFQHEVLIPLLPKDNTVTDKPETCNKTVKNKLSPSAKVKPVIDEQTTEWCLSEGKISSADIGSCDHIATKQKECIYETTESRISTVTLLKSPTGNNDENIDEAFPKSLVKSEDQNVENNLDWNRVFRFLANHLDAGKWILFFNTLYDNTYNRGSLNVAAKLKQVEHDTKQRVGSDTVTLLMEQFKAWKEYSGRKAKHTVIYRSLQDLHLNDTLEDFEDFMRDPPVLPAYGPEESYLTGNQWPDLNNSITLSLQGHSDLLPFIPQSTNTPVRKHTNDDKLPGYTTLPPKYSKYSKRICEVSYEVQKELRSAESNIDERDEPDGVSSQTIDSRDQTNLKTIVDEKQVPSNIAGQCIETKEITETVRSSSSQKRAKLTSSNFAKKRKRRHGQSKRIQKNSLKLSKNSFHTAVECILQNTTAYLPRDMYQILLQNTISSIVKETKVTENEVLSLTYEEYQKAQKVPTEKETIFLMYSGDTRIILEVSAFKNLQLYTDKARQQVIDRVGPNSEEENHKHLFIDYNGKRIHSQKNNGHLEDETRSNDSSGINIESTSASSDDD